jgi:predicted neutral ceramidase superfamily lipid hydrolase
MNEEDIAPILILFVVYLLVIIYIFNFTNKYATYPNIFVLGYVAILFLLILMLIALYIMINNAQFPTIETKKLKSQEIIDTILIHNLLVNKGLDSKQLEKNHSKFLNLCIKHKFSLDDDKITDIFNNLNELTDN